MWERSFTQGLTLAGRVPPPDRRFLRYSEDAARAYGIEPHQQSASAGDQGTAAEPSLPSASWPTVCRFATHSAVELINRLSQLGAVTRQAAAQDKREVLIRLTTSGERLLHALSLEHQTELSITGPALMRRSSRCCDRIGRKKQRATTALQSSDVGLEKTRAGCANRRS